MIFFFCSFVSSITWNPPSEFSHTPPPSTIPASTPPRTETRQEDYIENTVSPVHNDSVGGLLIAFVSLIGVAVLGVIGAVVYSLTRRNHVQVIASIDNDEEESDEAVMTRGFSTQGPDNNSSGGTVITLKSMYSVDTTIL